MAITHYMVDHLDEAGNVVFANKIEISSLTAAKSLAAKTSKQVDTGVYVVAFTNGPSDDGFVACGHISFFDGKQSDTDGIVI
jgi:methionine-rich copper-binding protein CopC